MPEENCYCRKPKPGTLNKIIAQYSPPYIFVGDNISDYKAASSIGMDFSFVKTGYGDEHSLFVGSHVPVFNDLLDFAFKLTRKNKSKL